MSRTTSRTWQPGRWPSELKSSWTGKGHDAFHDAITEWFSSAHDLRDQMHWIRDVVLKAHDNHATAVHTNVRIWRG